MALPLALILAAATAPASPVFELPIACTPGRDCFVQNYVDHDPGPGRKDYRCLSATYDKHTGTDIRAPTLKAMREGIAVKAAAAGRVGGARDGVVDRQYVDGADMHGQNCGNGVRLEHPGGWTTLYCHMRQGSVRVKPGQTVSAGQVLGLVGESGEAAFPHLHFQVMRAGQPVDPFAPEAGTCGGGRMLWSPAAARSLAYRSPAVLNQGFAGAPVSMEQIEAGETPPPTPGAPLVAYVRAIGLEAGDELSLVLTGPDGKELARNRPLTLAGAKAQYMLFAGARRPVAGWPKGVYRAAFVVRRAGRPALTQGWALSR